MSEFVSRISYLVSRRGILMFIFVKQSQFAGLRPESRATKLEILNDEKQSQFVQSGRAKNDCFLKGIAINRVKSSKNTQNDIGNIPYGTRYDGVRDGDTWSSDLVV